MAKMVRKQVYIESRHEELLKRRSRELGVTEAELIRRGIDEMGRGPQRRLAGPLDRVGAWEESERFIRERRALDVPQMGRAWTRDELYDERLARHSD